MIDFHRCRWQIIATLEMSVMMIAHGIALGWFSPMYVHLSSDDSPLDEKLSVFHASWIGSILGIGSFVCNLFMGFPLDYCGRKPMLFFLAIPNAIHWILIYFGTNAIYLYVARFLLGLSGGACFGVFPIFIVETSDISIRGGLAAATILALHIGLLMGYTMAFYIPYKVLPGILLIIPIVYGILVLFLHETPTYLLKAGKTEKAEMSYQFYKSLSSDNPASKAEFKEFQEEILINGPVEVATLKDYFTREAWKAYGVIFVLLFCHQMSGNLAILVYATTIFHNLESDLEVSFSTIVLGVVQLVGTILAIFLVDRVGRRILLLISLAGMGVGELVVAFTKFFASKEFLKEQGWLGLSAICFISIAAAMGVVPVTVLIVVELLPIKITSMGTSISLAVLSLFMFMVLKIYPVMIEESGLGSTMIMSATVCIVGCIFLAIFLKETKDKIMG